MPKGRLPLPLRPLLVPVDAWIDRALTTSKSQARPVAECGFPRLDRYYSKETLSRARVVVTDHLPVPQLPTLGLKQLESLSRGSYAGITFLDTFFVRKGLERDEALHFHELVHVVQWAELGRRRFMEAYGQGLLEGGYRHHPLERMAWAHELRFRAASPAYSVEEAIRRELALLYA